MEKCCCFSVRTGSIIIGTLSTISSLVLLIWLIIQMVSIPYPYLSIEKPDNLKFFLNAWTICLCLCIHSFLSMCFSISMIYGVLQKNAKHMYPWLALTFTSTVFGSCVSLAIIIVLASMLNLGSLLSLFILGLQIASASIRKLFSCVDPRKLAWATNNKLSSQPYKSMIRTKNVHVHRDKTQISAAFYSSKKEQN